MWSIFDLFTVFSHPSWYLSLWKKPFIARPILQSFQNFTKPLMHECINEFNKFFPLISSADVESQTHLHLDMKLCASECEPHRGINRFMPAVVRVSLISDFIKFIMNVSQMGRDIITLKNKIPLPLVNSRA